MGPALVAQSVADMAELTVETVVQFTNHGTEREIAPFAQFYQFSQMS